MKSTLNFVTPGADGSVKFVLDNGWTGTSQRSVPVPLHDMRPVADTLSIDREGFALTRIDSGVADYTDTEAVERLWKPAVEDMILGVAGGRWAVLFAGPNIRYSEAHEGSVSTSVSAPARAVHSDLPGNFAYDLMNRQPVTDEAVRVLRERLGDREPRRWRIFNIWQMLSEPPQDCTLTLCDRSSLEFADIVEGQGFFDEPEKPRNEILSRDAASADFNITFLRENPRQRWCFFADMEPDEAIVFSTFDPSAGPDRARVPHGAVDLPNSGRRSIPRNSIEIRALVVYEE